MSDASAAGSGPATPDAGASGARGDGDETGEPSREPAVERRLRRLEDRLEALDDALAARLAGYEQIETRLSFRLAELERSDQRLGSRLDEAARLETGLDERLERLDAGLRALDAMVDGRLPAGVERAEGRLREVADDVAAGLATRVAALERTEAGLGERLAALRRHDGELRQGLEGLQRAVASAEEVTETSLPAAAARIEETLRAQGSEADAAFAARLEALDEIADALGTHRAGLGELEAALAHRADEVGRAAGTVDTRAAALDGVEDELRQRAERLAQAVAELERVADGHLAATVADLERSVQAHTEATEATLAAQTAAAERADTRLEERTHGIARLESVLAERVAALEQAGSVLTERLGRLQQATASVERVGGSELTGRLDRLDRALASLAGVVDQLESGGEAVAASVAQQRDAQERQRRDLATAVRGAEARMVAAVQDGVAGFVTEATEASTAARTASERLVAALAQLKDVERTLADHRTSLADELGRDRRVLLDEILDRVLGELPARARRRLAERLLDHGAPSARSDGPVPSRPAGLRERAPGEPEAADAAPSADAAVEDGDAGEPSQDAPAPRTPPRAEVPVRPPRLAELLGEDEPGGDADGEPAVPDEGPPLTAEELRRAREERSAQEREHLAERACEVRGIGPARAQLLAEMYGDLDTLIAASAEDVATRTGLTEELAGEVLAQLRH